RPARRPVGRSAGRAWRRSRAGAHPWSLPVLLWPGGAAATRPGPTRTLRHVGAGAGRDPSSAQRGRDRAALGPDVRLRRRAVVPAQAEARLLELLRVEPRTAVRSPAGG